MESVAAARRSLPPGGPIPEDYLFDTLGPSGSPEKIKLSQLFTPEQKIAGHLQLHVPRWSKDSRPGPVKGATADLKREDSPCPSCTAFLDTLDRTADHFAPPASTSSSSPKAPIERIATYARERGWKNLRLLSSADNNFKRDYQAEDPTAIQLPLMTVFHRDGDQIRHFWTSELMFAPPEPRPGPTSNGTST